MRNLLALAALAVIGFVAIGWFRGWYSIDTTPTANGGRNINIDLNSPKITHDIKSSKDKLRDLLASDKKTDNNSQYFPDGVPAVFRSPNGGFELPLPPDTIDISDHDGWWPSSLRK